MTRTSARRRDPADIALEVLQRKIDQSRSSRLFAATVAEEAEAIRLREAARRIAKACNLPWAEAYANAEAIAKARQLDVRRRARHEADHLWCIASECPVAREREEVAS